MRSERAVLHAGYGPDPTTRAVAALFNLEAEGFRYSRISDPTNAVLERRLAALEGCVEALSEHVDDIVAGLDQALHAAGAER
jgi:O-acetylhomoserine (thiol)-lyase